MVLIKPFAVEQWMDAHETSAKINIAETCCASISVDDLRSLSEDKQTNPIQTSAKLTYGQIRGSVALRTNIANSYHDRSNPTNNSLSSPAAVVDDDAGLPADNVLVTPGAIHANFLLLYTLVSAGDHVICHYPTYQQLYSVPEALGAEVSLWRAPEESGWQLRTEDLRDLLRPNTKLIILNNPQNPTGAMIPEQTLAEVVRIAKERSIYVLCDEVYRPLFHSLEAGEREPPSLLSMAYERTIVTGSMSKAYALAGIRVGWIASRSRAVIEACAAARDYTTISVSQIDDGIAAFALGDQCVNKLLGRNIALAKTNRALLEEFMLDHAQMCSWIRPGAGTTAFIRFSRDGRPVDDVALCELLMRKLGLLVVPGSKCFGQEFQGYVRIGYLSETEVLQAGLAVLREFMKQEFLTVPLV